MDRLFVVTCACGKHFPVDYGIRHLQVQLECPYCRRKFRAEDAVELDERWS